MDIIKRVALIVGAGTVENAWTPIIDAINAGYSFGYRLTTTADGANCYLSRMVYLTRFYASLPDQKKALESMLMDLERLKLNIWSMLEDAQRKIEIKARKELELILKKFIFQANTASTLISTNWDTVVDEEVERMCKEEAERIYKITGKKYDSAMPAYHVHGSIKDENKLSLYLPSEYSRESYRTIEESELHMRKTSTLLHNARLANTIILYGLSLDPLDAELSQTISGCCYEGHVKEIVIINPDYERVAERVKILNTHNRPIKITCLHPSDL